MSNDLTYGQTHNHPWIEPEDNSLFHPKCDPRILQVSCEGCKKIMENWNLGIVRRANEGA